jgi:hypothetical protein
MYAKLGRRSIPPEKLAFIMVLAGVIAAKPGGFPNMGGP